MIAKPPTFNKELAAFLFYIYVRDKNKLFKSKKNIILKEVVIDN